MSEKQHKYLRQMLEYKPSHKRRKYKLIDQIVKFFKSGIWDGKKRQRLIDARARRIYQGFKKLFDRS